MDELQQHDVQFWLYNKVFIEHKSIPEALAFAAAEARISVSQAEAYLEGDGRLGRAPDGSWFLPAHDRDEARPDGVYVDIDWMIELLKEKGKLTGQDLYQALGIIYKLPVAEAREEAAAYGL